jgi:hypothetical protein
MLIHFQGELFHLLFIIIRAVRFQTFYLGFGSGFFGTGKPRFGSVSVIFKKEEQYKCMNSFMYVSSIFTK